MLFSFFLAGGRGASFRGGGGGGGSFYWEFKVSMLPVTFFSFGKFMKHRQLSQSFFFFQF